MSTTFLCTFPKCVFFFQQKTEMLKRKDSETEPIGTVGERLKFPLLSQQLEASVFSGKWVLSRGVSPHGEAFRGSLGRSMSLQVRKAWGRGCSRVPAEF